MTPDYSTVYYQCRDAIERARLAYAFASGTLTPQDAHDLIWHCQHIAGSYALATLDVSTVVEAAGYRWSNPAPDIRPLAEEACEHVYRKWDNVSDMTGGAEDWALSLIEEYAAEAGVELAPGERDEELP